MHRLRDESYSEDLLELHEENRAAAPADLVEVVRCKYCKHKIINENVPDKPLICCLTLRGGETKPEWFCKDGER